MEQFLNSNDSCRLIAINLYSFVNNPFTDKAEFDYKLFFNVVYDAMRLGDNLIDLEVEYIDKILEKIKSDPESEDIKIRDYQLWEKSKNVALAGRRVGLGITALGDTLAALNQRYDSDEALKIVEHIFKTKFKAELDCNIDLSIIRGHFKGFDPKKEFNIDNSGKNSFFNFLINEYPEQTQKMIKVGRRSVNWSTVAPTGSVSLLTQTTSGVEPLFLPYNIRRKKINPSEEGIRVDFVDDVGDSWQEFIVIHPKLKDYIHINYNFSYDEINNFSLNEVENYYKSSPWYNSTANDINWLKRVEIQSIIQKYTTNAISSTINLPSTITIDEVSKIYMHAWKTGLKGLTTYTEGSRAGVLVDINKQKSKVPIERPESIPCKVLKFKNEKKNWIAFVGTIDNRPYEIFTGINDIDEFPIPSYVEEGIIIKVKSEEKSRYDFQYVDNYGYTNTLGGLNRIFNKEYWNYARLVSALMREGTEVIDIINIIEKLEFTNRSLNSWQPGIIRALRVFVKDGTESKGEICPDCGEAEIIYESGCKICRNCGSSSCN